MAISAARAGYKLAAFRIDPMKRNLTIAILALAVFVAVSAKDNDDKAALKLEQEWVVALTQSDTDALERIYHNDLVYTHSSGAVDSKISYIASLKSGDTKYQSLDRTEIKVSVYGSTAIATCRAEIRLLNKGQPVNLTARLLHVYLRQNGRWQMIAHQSTRIAS
jgi:ketosteroid isomerase-like protein